MDSNCVAILAAQISQTSELPRVAIEIIVPQELNLYNEKVVVLIANSMDYQVWNYL